MSHPLVRCVSMDRVAVLTLCDPARRNVLSRDMLMELRDRIAELAHDPQTKCIVLAAEGPAYCAGHDLREVLAASPEELTSLFALCTATMESIRKAPQPVIAQVQGIATAAGCQLAATCDLVIAAEESSFATPGVKIGLFCTTPAVALSRAVRPKQAMEMLLTGQPISAAEAQRIGLVNRVVPRDQLEETTLELARQIADASGETLSLGKRALYEQLALDRPLAYKLAERVMVENAQMDDAREGMRAFLDKRPPKWRS